MAKEIRILIQELRKYPNNFFVYLSEESEDTKPGLVVKEYKGEEVGFIKVGGEEDFVL